MKITQQWKYETESGFFVMKEQLRLVHVMWS